MSMPTFPPHGADITKDEALTMIIASIAMEELALSHIINAEGEKLQYVLGTLPDGHRSCASTQEVLAVNKSITGLLDTVMQHQMLLKSKLEKALEASRCDPTPEKPEPCEPPCECEDRCRCKKSSIQVVSRCEDFLWQDSSLLSWRRCEQKGDCIHWSEHDPAQVRLDPRKTYALNYMVRVYGPCSQGNTGSIFIKRTPDGTLSDALPLHFSVKCPEGKPVTLQYSTVLLPQMCVGADTEISLLLDFRGGLRVERAALNIVEL